MCDDKDEIWDKVSKLISLASNNSNESEAAGAKARVQQILKNNNIKISNYEKDIPKKVRQIHGVRKIVNVMDLKIVNRATVKKEKKRSESWLFGKKLRQSGGLGKQAKGILDIFWFREGINVQTKFLEETFTTTNATIRANIGEDIAGHGYAIENVGKQLWRMKKYYLPHLPPETAPQPLWTTDLRTILLANGCRKMLEVLDEGGA